MAGAIIAAFDFDGTLVRGDSLPRFLLFAAGAAQLLRRVLPAVPVVIGHRAGIVRNDVAKERLLECVLGGRQIDEIRAIGQQFAEARVPGFVDPVAAKRLEWHRGQGHQCLLASASLDVYLRPWASNMGFDGVVCSELATDDCGRVTGRLRGGNCHGREKHRRLLELIGDRRDTILYAYGDSRGDLEMLEEADHAFFRMRPWTKVP